ncbi:MAG TPA: hypothetical protein VI197_21520 [Polyangiaceae bacterium]
MRIQIAVPEEHVSKPVLDGALEAVTRLNEQLIKDGVSPTADQLIARGAIWRPEPPGQEHFDHGGIIAKRGEGDCDDWAPLKAAQLRVTGEDPGARAVVKRSGEKRWHALVLRSDGSYDDPSLDAGMPGAGSARAAAVAPMAPAVHGVGAFINTPQLALRPVADRHNQIESWQARADLPWHYGPGDNQTDIAMVSLHRSPVSDQAVVGALRGAIRLGCINGAEPENLARLSAIADACEGCPFEELLELYGPEHAAAASQIVSGFFGKAFKKLGKGLGKIAKGGLKFVTKNPLAKVATSFIPGAGLATAAFNAASPAFKKSVAKQKHVPAAQRQPMAVSPLSRNVPAPALMRSAPAAAPIIQNFYYGSPPQQRPAAAARRPSTTRPVASARPGVAWPR